MSLETLRDDIPVAEEDALKTEGHHQCASESGPSLRVQFSPHASAGDVTDAHLAIIKLKRVAKIVRETKTEEQRRHLKENGPCARAISLVYGDRHEDYGHPVDDFARTAQIWSAIVGVEISPEQVPLMMIGLKISRLCHRMKRDSLDDGPGYFETLYLVLEEQKRRKENRHAQGAVAADRDDATGAGAV